MATSALGGPLKSGGSLLSPPGDRARPAEGEAVWLCGLCKSARREEERGPPWRPMWARASIRACRRSNP